MADIEADVIIVGSGISGALLAAKLSAAGVKVAILEAGARVDRAEARQRFWNAPIRVPECPYPPTPEANHPISNDPDYWYRQVGPNKFKSTYVKVVGGTTWHWLGTCLRFVPNDFRLRTAHGRGIDWPISYDELEPWPYRGPLSTSSIEKFRHGAFRKDRPAMRIEIGNDGWSWPKGAPVTTAAELARQGLRGSELNAALRDQAARHVRLASQVEQLPDPDNRVTLDPNERDMYGVPLPRLAYRLDDYVRTGLAAARAAHAEIFERLGASGIEHRDAPEGAGHIMGTARMGNDERDSVVDRNLRSHDHPNLFILGSAVFPTGATANPTLTLAALSLRSAGSVKAALSQ